MRTSLRYLCVPVRVDIGVSETTASSEMRTRVRGRHTTMRSFLRETRSPYDPFQRSGQEVGKKNHLLHRLSSIMPKSLQEEIDIREINLELALLYNIYPTLDPHN